MPDKYRPDDQAGSDDWRTAGSFWFQQSDLPERPKRMRHGVYGNGRLARHRDLAGLLAPRTGPDANCLADDVPHGLILPESTALAEASDDGTHLAPLVDSQLHLPQSLREKHLLAVGGTGAGKTSRLILPQLYNDICDPRRTIIALDAKGGVLFEYMAKLAEKYRPGQPVLQINMMRPARNTIVWNPVSSIECRSDALEIAHAVCSAVDVGKEVKDPFWLNSSIGLMSDVLLALALDPDEDTERSLAAVRAIVDSYPMGMAEFADAHPAEAPYPSEGFPAIYRALEGSTNVTQQSVVADLAQRLVMYGSEEITKCTGGPNELDLRELIGSAGMLVLEVWESDRDQLRPLTNLFVSRVFTTLIRLATEQPGGRLPCPVSLILDELGSAVGELPNFETRLSTLRSRGVSITGAVQSLSQLNHLYGSDRAEAIVSNFNTKLFFGGGLGVKDAAFASTLSGTMTAVAPTITDHASEGGLMYSASQTPVKRSVLLPEEVARPAVHPLLGPPTTIFPPDVPPFYVYLTPAHELPQTAWALAAKEPAPGPKTVAKPTVIAALPESIDNEIARLKHELGWMGASDQTKRWWQSHEQKCKPAPDELLKRLKSLHACLALHDRLQQPKGAFLEEFYEAVQRSGAVDFAGNVAFFTWRLTVRWEQQQNGRMP